MERMALSSIRTMGHFRQCITWGNTKKKKKGTSHTRASVKLNWPITSDVIACKACCQNNALRSASSIDSTCLPQAAAAVNLQQNKEAKSKTNNLILLTGIETKLK